MIAALLLTRLQKRLLRLLAILEQEVTSQVFEQWCDYIGSVVRMYV